jgi:hypothetical protein
MPDLTARDGPFAPVRLKPDTTNERAGPDGAVTGDSL